MSLSLNGRLAGRVSCVLVAALVVAGVVAAMPPQVAQADTVPVPPVTQTTVTADALPTVQIGNGVVRDQVIVGNTVYVAGEFTTARPAGSAPGVNEVPRSNLLAYNLTTGELLPWAPVANGAVRTIAASADGRRIYVGGSFTSISGVNRFRLAAIDATTGVPVAGFLANVESRVNDIAVSGDTLYIGGIFSVVANVARTRLAAVSATTGALLSWAPTADAEVIALTAPAGSGKVVVGGRFTLINGAPAYGMGAVDATTGASLPWAINAVVRNAGVNSAIYALKNDGALVYGSGYTFGAGGNYENAFAAKVADGAVEHVNGCRGDTYDIEPMSGALYQVGHTHDCAAIGGLPEQIGTRAYQRALATTTTRSPTGLDAGPLFPGQPVPQLLHWTPDITAGTYTGLDQGPWTVEGNGDYLVVGGEFPTVNGIAQQGLVRFARRGLAPNLEGPRAGQDLVPVADVTSVPGSVRLTLRASFDRDSQLLTYEFLRGDVLRTAQVIGTTTRRNAWYDREGVSFVDAGAPAGSTQTYRVRVTDPLGNVLVGNPVTVTVPAGAPTSAAYQSLVRADGALHHWRLGEAAGTTAVDWSGTDNLTLAAGATRGAAGPISGDTDRATTFPGSSAVPAVGTALTYAPRTLAVEAWIRTTTTRGGKIVGFGSSRTGASTTADRHLYMTNSGNLVMGIQLGGTQAVATSPAAYNDGAWHHVVGSLGANGLELYVDGARVASNTSLATSGYYRGYWRVGGDTLAGWPNAPTSNAFAGTVDEVAVYPAPLSAATVAAHWDARNGVPNKAPTAAFTTTSSDLTLGVDGSGSTDADGSVTAYSWSFGDGSTATGATATHTYAAAGTYTVTLTVTDNKGATGTTARPVTVAAATAASDAFGRTLASGLGTADIGGAWTVTGSTVTSSVGGGSGALTVPVSRTGTAMLNSVSSTNTDVSVTVWPTAAVTGGGVYVSSVLRSGAGGDYRVRARIQSTGVVTAGVSKVVAGVETFLAAQVTVPGVTFAPGAKLRIRAQVTGTNPTQIAYRVWLVGTPEPTTWLQTVTDSTAGLQAAGAVGAVVYVSASSTAPVTLRIDDLVATKL